MNFFERQDKARALSLRLTLMFILAVFLTIAAVHSLVAFGVYMFSSGGNESQSAVETAETRHGAFEEEFALAEADVVSEEEEVVSSRGRRTRYVDFLFSMELFLFDLFVVGGLILVASFLRFLVLSGSGPEGVVKLIGGTPLVRGGSSARDRRLYNVVEEIAIASGTPVPQIYVLENEHSVNACAVGTSPENAAVCVTAGALELLSRDELQGVVAHEFSHIVNRDMSLNMRLIGVLFGIEFLSIIALFAIRILICTRPSSNRSSGNDKGGGAIILVLLLMACVLYVIGVVGVVFGNMIRAAISRQREYLADASAVQFTRNPRGISGALKKIGNLNVGSSIGASGSEQTSHMFFGSVFKPGFFQSLYRTHPPLVERIKAIDPSFDGVFPEKVEPVKIDERSEPTSMGFQRYVASALSTTVVNAPAASVDTATLYGDWAKGDGGAAKDSRHIKISPRLLEPIPSMLDDVLIDASGARAVVYAVLFSREPDVFSKQLAFLKDVETDVVQERLPRVFELIKPLTETTRLIIVRIATPLLKTMPIEQYRLFRKIVVDFCLVDGRLDLFEYALQNVVLRELDVYYRLSKPIEPRYSAFRHVAASVRNVLSCLALAGEEKDGDAQEAFRAGCEVFEYHVDILDRQSCALSEFSKSLNQLAFTSSGLKQKILEACWKCVLWDGAVTERESALLSAVTAALGVPAPVWREWSRR